MDERKLKRIEELERRILATEGTILRHDGRLRDELRELRHELREEERKHQPHAATHFSISQGEVDMALTPLDPGSSPVFTASPTPAGSSIFGAVPTWTSSDPTNAPVTVDATGLTGTVALSTSITVGEQVTLMVSASFTDENGNSQSITGSVTFTVGAPPPVAATGFSIVQTA